MKSYTLSAEALRQIQRLVRQELMVGGAWRPGRTQETSGVLPFYLCETPAGGIAARSGTTLSSAVCTVKRINSTNQLVTATDGAGNAITVTVFNLSGSAVAGSALIAAQQEIASGKLIVNVEDCS